MIFWLSVIVELTQYENENSLLPVVTSVTVIA